MCCGKTICSGCIYAVARMDKEEKCPFCRIPTFALVTDVVESLKKRTDTQALYHLAWLYDEGIYGFSQDYAKALELWHRAAELGYTKAYCNIGCAYDNGRGVERNEKKAVHYYELAAMGGDELARYALGILEMRSGNIDRALKHFMIAAGGGYNESLNMIQQIYKDGHATKDDYAKALRAYQKYLDEIRSSQRDKAAAFNIDRYRYY